MSASVDLLGNLDRAIAGMEDPVRERRERLGYRDRLIDVRAAVTELVEAVRNYRDNCARLKADYPGDDPFPRAELDRHQLLKGQMFAAVDRFGGAK